MSFWATFPYHSAISIWKSAAFLPGSAVYMGKTIQVRYRKGPHMQNSIRKLKLTLYNPTFDPNRYRRRCPGPNARIQKFIHYMAIAAICDSGPL